MARSYVPLRDSATAALCGSFGHARAIGISKYQVAEGNARVGTNMFACLRYVCEKMVGSPDLVLAQKRGRTCGKYCLEWRCWQLC